MNDLLKILFLSFMTMTVNSIFAHSIEICHGWQFKQARGENWYPATVPGTVHTDLLANGIIEDPFVGLNERGVQWVDKEDWVYQTTFNVDEKILKKTNIQIEFEGLDTYADVYLNDSLIIKADNMFRRWNADVRSLLRLENNLLRVYFHSPVKVDMPKWEAIPYHYEAMNDQSQNGGLMDRKISVFARKAGYHYGWDWGPRLVTSGIWRKVYLQAWDGVRITDVHTQQLKVNKYVAQIRQTIEVISDSDYVAAVRTIDTDTNKKYINKKVSLRKGLNRIQSDFSIKNPKLWWSNGLGDPHLYGFKTEVRTDATVNDRLKALKGKVSIMILDMNGNEINRIEKNVCVSANTSQDVLNFPVDGTLMALDRKDVVIEASFTCDKVYKNVYYLCPPKDVNFFKPSISSQIVKVGDGYDVVLKTDKVARGVFLSLDGIDNDFTDNYFDLLPFREKVVHIRTPFKEDEIAKQLKITSLADVNKN